MYCGVDRAASSTVKTILRTLKGLSPFPTQPWKVHDRHVNGLRYLDSPEYTGVNEAKGIRQVSECYPHFWSHLWGRGYPQGKVSKFPCGACLWFTSSFSDSTSRMSAG